MVPDIVQQHPRRHHKQPQHYINTEPIGMRCRSERCTGTRLGEKKEETGAAYRTRACSATYIRNRASREKMLPAFFIFPRYQPQPPHSARRTNKTNVGSKELLHPKVRWIHRCIHRFVGPKYPSYPNIRWVQRSVGSKDPTDPLDPNIAGIQRSIRSKGPLHP